MPADRAKLEQVAADLYGDHVNIEHLGSGGFASTFRVGSGSDAFAVKVLDPTVADFSRFDKELAALQRIDSPHVVKFRAHGRNWFDGEEYGYIEMALAAGHSLAAAVDGGQVFTVLEAAQITRRILEGASAIWQAGTAHRDLSPKNVLLGPDHEVVIIDLGLAKHIDDESQTTLPTPGTPGWMSPEQVNMTSSLTFSALTS